MTGNGGSVEAGKIPGWELEHLPASVRYQQGHKAYSVNQPEIKLKKFSVRKNRVKLSKITEE